MLIRSRSVHVLVPTLGQVQCVLIFGNLQVKCSRVGLTTQLCHFHMSCPCIGGLGFTLKEIGISLTVAGALMLPMTMFAFPLVRCILSIS